MKTWWLSFCDVSRPKGSQFLGACLVRSDDFIGAIRSAHLHGCNPGGEVQGMEIAAGIAPFIAKTWLRRLLTKAECILFDDEIQQVCEAARQQAQETTKKDSP